MVNKVKRDSLTNNTLIPNANCALPLWDDAQIQQENWGGSIGLPARTTGAVVEFRNTEGKIVVTPDASQHESFRETITSVSSSATGEVYVDWRRPVDIFAPFRPIVHRNMVPFLSPYDTAPKVFNSKEAEETARASVVPTGKKGDSKSAIPPLPLHVQFPEIVQVLESPALEGAMKEWEGVSDKKIIQRYRELQLLMQAYDPNLELGCAETPAEACESGYSTSQRHRIEEVDAISKLTEPPPFLMDAFNSAISFIEHVQSHVNNGEYLWELVYPHAPGTCHPVYNPYGKYAVKLFIEGAFRRITIDDYLPVDALGRPFLTLTSQKEIWPALLAKAIFLGLSSSRHLLFTDPETIITCLWGAWVPQRLDPRMYSAESCAFLLKYRKELPGGDDNITGDLSVFGAGESTTPVSEGETTPPPTPRNISLSEDKRSKKETAIKVESNGDSLSAAAITSAEENMSLASSIFPVCAVGSLGGGKRKLFIIHEIVFFRNTIALRISTNPPLMIHEAKILTEVSEDGIVRDSLHQSAINDAKRKLMGDISSSNQCPVWVTFNALAAHLDLVIWRHFDEKSPFQFTSRIIGMEDAALGSTNPKKKAGSSTGTNLWGSGGKRNTVRWIHIVSAKPEELAFVSLASFSGSSNSFRRTRSQAQSMYLSSRPHSAQSIAHSVDSRYPREAMKEISVDLYTWERGDVLARVRTFLYESGKLQCMVHKVPAGSHILKVTAVALEPQHVLGIFSTREFFMGDEKEALRSANIFKMTDAGFYTGVERVNEEVMWFKRHIAVKEPTLVSFVISTLDPSEDPANYRDIPGPLVKDPKGARSRFLSVKIPPKDSAEEAHTQICTIPIIPYCHILLLNVDNGEIRAGSIGRLVRQRLEPNQNGYILMAYVLIDSVSANIFMEKAIGMEDEDSSHPREGMAHFISAEEKETLGSPEKNLPLCGRGVWKLSAAANHPLETYKSVSHNLFTFSEKGQLKRGSHALLFAYTCNVSERISFTLILDLDAHDPMPFQVRISRNGVDAPPVFVSDISNAHLFVPHIMLEMSEKSKSTGYIIEAWLDETKVKEWEEKRRLAQEMKFRSLRTVAENKCNERLQRELDEYNSDPRAFVDHLEQLNMTHLEHAATSSIRETLLVSTKKGRLNPEKRKNPVPGAVLEKVGFSALANSGTVPNSDMLLLDTTDGELIVSFDLRLQFSAKVDIKNGVPPKDPLATLRSAWVPPIDHVATDQGAGGAMQRGGGVKAKQREAVLSVEELLKADQGRLSRQRFLENPRNILLPYLALSEEYAAGNKESARSGSSKEQGVVPVPLPRVVTNFLEEDIYFHAPILSESDYRIRMPPFRAYEFSAPTSCTPPNSASDIMQQRIKSPGERLSSRLATSSPALLPGGAADEDADVTELKAPLQDLLRRQVEEIKQEYDKRAGSRESNKEIMREFWGPRCPDTPFTSLFGNKEEESSKRRKSRLKISN